MELPLLDPIALFLSSAILLIILNMTKTQLFIEFLPFLTCITIRCCLG